MLEKFFRQLIIITASLCFLFGTFSCAKAERTAVSIIRDIINDYGYQKDGAAGTIEALFVELNETDPAQAETWREVYDYWKYANNEMQINTGIIPEGLPEDDSLCFVVLGYALMPDGTMKPELEGRLTVALQCAEKYPHAYILCTGGGTASENESATEAGVMADWLTENGIAANRIITEGRSLTTGQNAIFSCRILSEEYPGINSLVIVSSDYHIPWGTVMFQSECILKNAEGAGPNISVIANAAYETDHAANDYYLTSQASGLLEILNDSENSGDMYYGTIG